MQTISETAHPGHFGEESFVQAIEKQVGDYRNRMVLACMSLIMEIIERALLPLQQI